MIVDPLVEVGLVEADELSDLEVVDPSLGDESTDEAGADVEVVGGRRDVEQLAMRLAHG